MGCLSGNNFNTMDYYMNNAYNTNNNIFSSTCKKCLNDMDKIRKKNLRQKKLENCLTYRLFNYIEHINSQTNDYDHLYPIKLLIY